MEVAVGVLVTLQRLPPSGANSIEHLLAEKSNGYLQARALVQATMPHSKVAGNEFQRIHGAFTLTILTPFHLYPS